MESIRQGAVGEGAGKVAETARALIESLRSSDATDLTALQNGIAGLQEATESRPAPKVEPSLGEDPELLTDFVVESNEHLANIESQLLVLEHDPANAEALHSIFRNFHTMKGLAGFLELWEIQNLAHEVETVLDQARNLSFAVTPAAIDVILACADYLKRWLTHLDSVLQKRASSPPEPDSVLLARVAAIPSNAHEASPEKREPAGARECAVAQPAEAKEARRASETAAVRVDTSKLDYLVDMAGEMVIAETMVRHDPELARLRVPRLQRNLSQLTRITGELQKTVMAMRLVPVGPLFRRMARLVRDLSRQFGRPTRLETEGDEIELDRTIVEELADPLLHMVRNALDHGIEDSEVRKACGKPAVGRLLLKAQHLAGQVVIEVSDDGRGLDRKAILAKAAEKGLAPSGQLSDSEVFDLIFKPGFSTAAKVTSVSGRGVGMDVVRRHIEKLRGRTEIRSVTGRGTTFLLKLPLTLAIIDGLVVGVGRERYIVPLFAVREIFRPRPGTISTVQQKAEMALVRGSLVPVVRLYRRFGLTPRSEDPLQGVLVVADVESQRFCLLVDDLIGKQEVVIKSLGETFSRVPGISGGAILGDGRVGLILDVEQLFCNKAGDGSR